MSEAKYAIQNFELLDLLELIPKVRSLKEEGYRLVQACATRSADGTITVIYSFDLDHVLYNFKVIVPENLEMQSITDSYWSAFIYENEMRDLFGIRFHHLALDYGGNFFKVAMPRPWNPEVVQEEEKAPEAAPEERRLTREEMLEIMGSEVEE